MDVQVLAPSTEEINVTVEIAAKDGENFEAVKTAAEESITSLFSGKLLGKAVRLAEIGNLVYDTPGIENYRILSPEADLEADDAVLPVLGTLTVTEMGA